MFSKLPVVGSGDKFAAKSVTYGKLPEHFAQVTPDSGPPEPLEVGHYYIFTAQRASGTLSYEAVRVETDGSLDGYEAEPRAGTSYVLCCNVNPGFRAAHGPGDSGGLELQPLVQRAAALRPRRARSSGKSRACPRRSAS